MQEPTKYDDEYTRQMRLFKALIDVMKAQAARILAEDLLSVAIAHAREVGATQEDISQACSFILQARGER